MARAGVDEARRLGRDVCIIDTAGRLTIDADLMEEIRGISAATEPHYTFLVIDAMIGQDAVATAKAFHETLELDGVILSKLDGDARGGAALSVKGVVGKPIAFASTGERLADFDLFHPDRMADRILGMGDVLSLIEQAERTMDHDAVAKGAARLMQGHFTLEDFLSQLRQVRKMGSLGGLMKLMPGMSKEMRQAAGQIDDGEISRVEAIVCSMTPAERDDVTLIDGSRRSRVARGSGTSVAEVNTLLKQFKEMQKMMKGMASGNMPNIPGMGGMGGWAGWPAWAARPPGSWRRRPQPAPAPGVREVPTSTCSPSSWGTPATWERRAPCSPACPPRRRHGPSSVATKAPRRRRRADASPHRKAGRAAICQNGRTKSR